MSQNFGGSALSGSRMAAGMNGSSMMAGTGSRMMVGGGSRMGGSQMAAGMGSRMGGSRVGIGGSQMGGGMGSRMGGSRLGTGTALINSPTTSMLDLGQQQQANITGPGNPTKTVVNEDEMTVQGIHFVERKELIDDGIQSIVKHARMIDDSTYEVVATMQGGNITDINVNTNLEDEEDVYMMEQLWYNLWGYGDEQQQYGGLPNQGSAMIMGGSRMTGGSQMSAGMGSRMIASGGSRMVGSQMAAGMGSRMTAARSQMN